jgi:hypothetical protein
MPKLSDIELLSIIDGQEKNSLGWGNGDLNKERESALNAYFQEPYGNEVEGRSQYVTSEVADTVEWIKPSLMKIFSSTDKVVEFEPQNPSDEASARQVTDVMNFLFMKRNQGFFVLQDWFSDALLTKNGYVKVWWDKTTKRRRESYSGLTIDQLSMLMQDSKVKLLGQNEVMTEFGPTYDVQIEVERDGSQVCVAVVPPEEMLISRQHRSMNLDDCEFVSHRRMMTLSELKEMGHDVDDIGGSDEYDYFPESDARDRYDTEQQDGDHLDKSLRRVWVSEAYLLVDYDGDGIAELRRVLKAGNKILENEEADLIPFAAITPIVLPHRHYGRSVAELVEDLQFLKTTLWRQVLDNIYLTNNPRNAVLSGQDGSVQANLDDLLNVRVGGIVREYVQGAVRPLTVPFVAKEGLNVLEYVDTIRENRTGVTRYNQGLDANSLNKTASGITQIMTAAQQRIELIARIFAEGMKDMFKLMLHCQTKYGMQREAIKLRDQWIEYDPREWANEYDMSVSVGLGTGNKDQQLVHLNTIAQAQQVAVQMGGLDKVVTLKNMYNVQAKIVENAGFKAVEEFWTDPETVQDQQQEPQPDPEMEKAKQELELQRAKGEQEMSLAQQKAELDMQIKVQQAQLDAQLKQGQAAQGPVATVNIDGKEQIGALTESLGSMAQDQAARLEQAQMMIANAAEVMASAAATVQQAMASMSAPKRVIRDEMGRVAGVEAVPMQ